MPGSEANRLFVLGRAAELYYDQELSQEEVARELKVSRPTVSRLLKEARQEGIVQIIVRTSIAFNNRLEEGLRRAFPFLRKAIVVATFEEVLQRDQAHIQRDVARAAAEHINRVVTDGSIIGVAWGSTMAQVVQHLVPKQVSNTVVVQIKGSVSRVFRDTNAQEITRRFGHAYNAQVYYLPVPTVVDSVAVKQALLENRETTEVLDLGRRANIAVYSIGVTEHDSVLFQTGYLTQEQIEALKVRGVVGNIIARHFDINGAICDPQLDERTIGLPLAEFAGKEHAIAIVIGRNKARSTLGALRGGYLNELVIDQATAEEVLKLHEL